MNQVPREEFVRRSERDLAYADEALPIEAGQTISQPYIVARMTELLAPRAGDRVLEIGTGSGYQAAILALLGAAVLTIERQPELAALARERLARLGLGGAVEVRVGDGSVGDAGGRAVGRDHRRPPPRRRSPTSLREQLVAGRRAARHPGRRPAPPGPAARAAARRRVARDERRAVRVRAARRRGGLPGLGGGRRAGAARYTRPAMTHVFVAPHPDDVALSCGGLIASLRELGQNVAIITVFSGGAGGEGLSCLPARGARLRVEGDVAGDRGVQPGPHRRRLPGLRDPDALPAWAATDDPARGDAGRRRRGREAVLAALVVVPPGEHPGRVAGRPAGDRRPVDAGRGR